MTTQAQTIQLTDSGPMTAISPEVKIAMLALIREYLGQVINTDFLYQRIDEAIHSRDESIYRSSQEYVKERMTDAVEKGYIKKLDDYIAIMNLNNERRVKAVEDTVYDLRQKGMPDYYVQQIHNLDRKVQEVLEKFQMGMNRLNYLLQTKFVEAVNNEEIQHLYLESKLGLKNIAEKFHLSKPQASRLVNGNTKDADQRHQLKVFLEDTIRANSEKGIV